MSKSTVRSIIITSSAMVGITASITSGAAGAWSDGSEEGLLLADAATNSSTQPQSSESPAVIPSASATTALITDDEDDDEVTTPTTPTKKSKTKKPTTKKKSTPTTPAPQASSSSSTPAQSGATDGTFTGASASAGFYGTVQVQIVVSGGQITTVNVLKAPSGKNSSYTNYAVPILTQETLDAQSANISAAGGASFTSRAYIKSLQSALIKAGL